MPNDGDNPLPLYHDLCFDSRSFNKEHFSVDEFLQEHRNRANLETMRDDLGAYLQILRSAMIDLINKDYADFVDLSSNLIGLDKGINRIQLPLGQLREELIQVKQSLEGAMNEVNNQLAVRRELRERRRSLRSLSHVYDSTKKLKSLLMGEENETLLKSEGPLVLERATSVYIQLVVNSQRSLRDLKDSDSKVFQTVDQLLSDACNRFFLESINSGEEGRNSVHQCLHFYTTLNRVDRLHQLYKREIVAPVMRQLINQNALTKMPGGLSALYGKLLDFIDSEMKILIQVSHKFNSDVGAKKYDFLLESFWPEVEERIETELNPLFASGDPNVFYLRYRDTLNFLEALIGRCNLSQNAGNRALSNFDNFMDKWNIPVYFQLRFQEIVRLVEKALINDKQNEDGVLWKLNSSKVVYNCLLRCWEDGVFLLPLAHKFWKLSLQIVSRYITWIRKTILNVAGKGNDLNYLVSLYTDVESLGLKLPDIRELAATKFPSARAETTSLLTQSLEETLNELKCVSENISQAIVKGLCSETHANLRQVNDIPRLFRRTDREAPTKPCPYVFGLLEKAKQFYTTNQTHPKVSFWLQTMFSEVTKQYYSSVDDVLNSVKKTEECLRRLKKARDKSSNAANTNDKRVGDDNKIRQQLVLDVQAYLNGIENFGLKKSAVDRLAELLLLVESSQ